MAKGKRSKKSAFKVFKQKKKLLFVLLVVIVLGIWLFQSLQNSQQYSEQTYVPSVEPTKEFLGTPTPTLLPYKEATEHDPQRAEVKDGYALIPELGIKMRVGSELNDLIYSYYTYYGPEYQNYQTSGARFTTQTLLNADKWCTAKSDSIGLIGKSLDNPIGQMSSPQEEDVKKFGDFYYHFLGPQATCSGSGDVVALESKQIKLLKAAFQTVEPIQ